MKKMIELAEELGLYVAVANPQDGLGRRYRFFRKTDCVVKPSFDSGYGIFTSVGLKQASIFLKGIYYGKTLVVH